MPPSSNPSSVFSNSISEHLDIIRRLASQEAAFQRAADLLIGCLLRGSKIVWCGNGGSAADAQHLAAELVGRFRRPRCALNSFALTADVSVLTAISNDFGFEKVFERQVEALCQPGDVVVGLSTSGDSGNVCGALRRARQLHISTVAITGEGGGRLAEFADICLRVPSTDTARIQEAHILLGHMLCESVDAALCLEEQFEAAGALV
ncbi:MAG TPA: SIS domain-containing protein [Terriglobales bacterium]|nr:SIS domain-containing protein [Terriglobales bacterium]